MILSQQNQNLLRLPKRSILLLFVVQAVSPFTPPRSERVGIGRAVFFPQTTTTPASAPTQTESAQLDTPFGCTTEPVSHPLNFLRHMTAVIAAWRDGVQDVGIEARRSMT